MLMRASRKLHEGLPELGERSARDISRTVTSLALTRQCLRLPPSALSMPAHGSTSTCGFSSLSDCP